MLPTLHPDFRLLDTSEAFKYKLRGDRNRVQSSIASTTGNFPGLKGSFLRKNPSHYYNNNNNNNYYYYYYYYTSCGRSCDPSTIHPVSWFAGWLMLHIIKLIKRLSFHIIGIPHVKTLFIVLRMVFTQVVVLLGNWKLLDTYLVSDWYGVAGNQTNH